MNINSGVWCVTLVFQHVLGGHSTLTHTQVHLHSIPLDPSVQKSSENYAPTPTSVLLPI